MQKDELTELVRRLAGTSQGAGDASILQGWRGADAVASDVRRLTATDPVPAAPAQSSSRTASVPGDSTATTVLKTAGMMTGVGPLVTGLMKLFGGRDRAPEPPPLTSYSLPQRVSVEAGLAADGSFVPVSHSQSGDARPATGVRNESAVSPQVQIHVQAMDSRSFLDHSDDIARAVREAMLRSHSLNDVVSEL